MNGDVKSYHIEFHLLSFKATDQLATLGDAFQLAIEGKISICSNAEGFTREIWRLKKRSNGSYAGEMRKFRNSNLPDKGAPGKLSTPIPLGKDEGIIEKNFFVFYPDGNILGWHYNHIACGVTRFSGFLTTIFGSKVRPTPLLEKDSIDRIMKGNTGIKKIQLTIPRPRSSEIYPDTDFSKRTLQVLADTGGDTLKLEVGIDSKRGDSEGKLKRSLRYAMQEFVDFGAKKAVIEVFDDDGIVHPIDLIANRIKSTQSAVTDARFPPAETMYGLIDTAYAENRESINVYTGNGGTGTID